jgi:dolichyl-phosphate-mannose--protein O-mannosyl transferase
MKDRKNLLAVSIVAVTSVFTRLIFFGMPAEVVFDETYFLKFIGYYWNGSYFFDVHPPFAKLLFVLFAYLTGVTPSADIGSIGTTIDPSLVLFRLVPLVVGILLPVVIYYICRNLNISRTTSVVAGLFVCLENTLIIQSRFVLIDIILITAGFSSILFYLIYKNSRHSPIVSRLFLYASALSFAFCVSTKWTGLFFIVPIAAFEIWDLMQNKFKKKALWQPALHTLVYFLISCTVYVSLFFIHFSLLPHSGPGDAFMTRRFQHTLIGSTYASQNFSEQGFVEKFFELNIEMFQAHTRMTKAHTYSSKFYTWPLMTRPIYYWYHDEQTTPPTYSRIYLLGNPVLYWGGAIAIVLLILMVLESIHTKRFRTLAHRRAIVFVLIGYGANFIPFIFIGRVMFIYHYAAALVFSMLALAFLLEYVISEKRKCQLAALLIALSVIAFAYFSPLTYGTPLEPKEYESKVWLNTWM